MRSHLRQGSRSRHSFAWHVRGVHQTLCMPARDASVKLIKRPACGSKRQPRRMKKNDGSWEERRGWRHSKTLRIARPAAGGGEAVDSSRTDALAARDTLRLPAPHRTAKRLCRPFASLVRSCPGPRRFSRPANSPSASAVDESPPVRIRGTSAHPHITSSRLISALPALLSIVILETIMAIRVRAFLRNENSSSTFPDPSSSSTSPRLPHSIMMRRLSWSRQL